MPHITVTEPPDDDQGHGPSASTTRATSPSESRPSSSSTADHSTAPLHLAVPQAAHTTTSSRGGRDRSGSSVTMPETTLLNPDHPPPLDSWHFSLKGPLIYLVFLLVCNVLIPCVSPRAGPPARFQTEEASLADAHSTSPQLLYYLLRENTHLTDKELIGIGSAALGVSSCFDAPLRFWRRACLPFLCLPSSSASMLTLHLLSSTVTRHRAKYGPLYYPHAPDPAFEPAGKRWLPKEMPRSFWHLDFTMWCYQAGLFAMAVPLAIAPAVPLLCVSPSALPWTFPSLAHADARSPAQTSLVPATATSTSSPSPCSSSPR